MCVRYKISWCQDYICKYILIWFDEVVIFWLGEFQTLFCCYKNNNNKKAVAKENTYWSIINSILVSRSKIDTDNCLAKII